MRKTLILVLLAALLGAYVWFFEIEGEEERQAQKELEEKVISIPKDSIKTVVINDFDKTFKFEKKDDNWIIEAPVATGADESAVSSLLSSLSNAKKSRSFSVKPEEKRQYGLNNNLIRVKVIAFNGQADSVQLGMKTSIGEDMYITRNNQDTMVAITPISLKNNAQKSLFSWRDKKVLHFNKDQVRSFNFKNGGETYSFAKEGSDWALTKPLEAKADNSTVNAILNKIDFGRIKTVEAEQAASLSKYKLTDPQYKIEIFSGPELAKSTVSFSRLDGNTAYGKDEVRPHIFTVDSTFIKPFKKSLFDFRDKDLVDFNKPAINRINLLNGSELLMFSKDTSDRWQIASGEPVKNYKINDLLTALDNMKVDAFVAEKPAYLMPYELANPKKKIELFAGDSKEVELEFGKVKNDQMYVRIVPSGRLVALKQDKLDKVLLTMKDVFDPTAAMVDSSKVK